MGLRAAGHVDARVWESCDLHVVKGQLSTGLSGTAPSHKPLSGHHSIKAVQVLVC